MKKVDYDSYEKLMLPPKSKAKRGPPSSPRMLKASELVLENRRINCKDALRLAGYPKYEADSIKRQNNLSKAKTRLYIYRETLKREAEAKKKEAEKATGEKETIAQRIQNVRFLPHFKPASNHPKSVSLSSSASLTSLSTLSSSPSNIQKKRKPKNVIGFPLHRNVVAPNSRRTPAQLLKALASRKEEYLKKNAAYEWTINEAKRRKQGRDVESVTSICARATEKFDLPVAQTTVYTMLREGRTKLITPGAKGYLPEENLKVLGDAILSYIAIGQINGDREVKAKNIVSLLESATRPFEKKFSCRHLWDSVRAANPLGYSMEKEMVIELRRQQWTTRANLNLWFDSWKRFLLTMDFGMAQAPIGVRMEGEIYISNEQRKRILNLDETAISLDGSEGRVGGRPAASIVAKGVNRAGTAANKSGAKETLVCGSNAFAEAMPPVLILSSSAQQENRAVRLSWVSGLPQVEGFFGHSEKKKFSTIVLSNEKGGTDADVLHRMLKKLLTTLYPDAADVPEKRFVLKVDGGPGRLQEAILADLRLFGCYLFPSVQNTTQVTQETDQNYGEFKSTIL